MSRSARRRLSSMHLVRREARAPVPPSLALLLASLSGAACGGPSAGTPSSLDLAGKLQAPTVPPRVDGEALDGHAARLSDPDAAVRRDAVEALSTYPASSLAHLGAAASLLEDADPRVRWATLEWLGRVGEAAEPHAARVVARLADEHAGVRLAAVRAVASIPGTSASLAASVGHEASDVRALARASLLRKVEDGSLDRAAAAARLATFLSSDTPGPAEDAADLLGRLGEAALQPLLTALATDDTFVMVLAAGALGKLGAAAAPAIEPLAAALLRRGGDVRSTAFDALAAIGAAARPRLEALAASEDEDIAEPAQLALSRLR